MNPEAPDRRARSAGTVVCDSSICLVDGERGRLSFRGYDVADLAGQAAYEEVAGLLWSGGLPSRGVLDSLRADLTEAATLPGPVEELLRRVPPGASPMAVLRTAISALGLFDPDAADNSEPANARKAVRLTAQAPVIVAGFHRLREGEEPLRVLPDLGFAANYIYMITGSQASEGVVRALDTALVLHADHDLNTSTFAARVAASTLSEMHSAVAAAIGTLKGPLHGGAGEAVMRLLELIGSPERVEPMVRAVLDAKGRVPGFGHTVYRVEDPRVRILREISVRMGEFTGEPMWHRLAAMVEESMTSLRPLHANVDLYSATLYRALGIPPDLFTATFAVARMAGWTAHLLEQYRDNRMIRPLSNYVGPPPRAFVTLDERR